MKENKHIYSAPEPVHARQGHLLCWKSVLSGVLISIMSYMILTALGAGVLGAAARSAIENESGATFLASSTGLWLGISIVISLFMGSYFAVRMSQSFTNKMGAAHGFVVASIFFVLAIMAAGSAVGSLLSGFGNVASNASEQAMSLANNPMVQDSLNRAIGTANLKAPPQTVAEGLAVRLAQGDTESAKAYFAYQTGLSTAEVNTRIAQLQTEFKDGAKRVGDKAALAVASTGWGLFVTFIIGLLGALFGGRVAAHANVDRPIASEEPATGMGFRGIGGSPVLANQRGSAAPYILGWLMGVPMSILLMIALLRSVF